jgi:hypothetical protein
MTYINSSVRVRNDYIRSLFSNQHQAIALKKAGQYNGTTSFSFCLPCVKYCEISEFYDFVLKNEGVFFIKSECSVYKFLLFLNMVFVATSSCRCGRLPSNIPYRISGYPALSDDDNDVYLK